MFRHLPHAISATMLIFTAAGPVAVHAESRDEVRQAVRSAGTAMLSPKAGVRPLGLIAKGGPTRANDPHDLPCPADEIFVIYDEDENGNRVPGTEVYGCTDP